MADKVKVDIDYIASPSIDIEKMEAEDVAGFDFELPVSLFPKFYQSDDYEVLVTSDLNTTDTVIAVDTSSDFTASDYIWLKNELLKVVSVDSSTQITVLRGQYNTFAQKYTINNDTQQYYYIRKYPKTFIGQRVFLYENEKLLSIGLIKEQPSFSQGLMSFNCTNAIDSLDVDFTFPAGSSLIGQTYPDGDEQDAVSTLNLNRIFNYAKDESFAYEMPPILDYVRVPVSLNIIQGVSDTSFMLLSELPSILEYLKLYGKINASVFTWDYSEEVFTFMNISDVSSLDSISDAYLAKYNDISKSYTARAYTGISQISVKLWNTTININNTNTSQFASKDVFEIDLSKIYGIERSDVNSIIFYYIRLFAIIYSELTIPTHAIKFEDFTEGLFYNILDIDKFYTFQDVSTRAFCLSKDEDNIKFLITRDVEKNMIAPALTGEVTATNTFTHDDTIQDFIDTDEDNVEDAKIERYDFPYFTFRDKLMFVKDDGTKITNLQILSISNKSITFYTSVLTIGDKGYLTYDDYSSILARQQNFFFLNVNEW
jgi:hypothetical protein